MTNIHKLGFTEFSTSVDEAFVNVNEGIVVQISLRYLTPIHDWYVTSEGSLIRLKIGNQWSLDMYCPAS